MTIINIFSKWIHSEMETAVLKKVQRVLSIQAYSTHKDILYS